MRRLLLVLLTAGTLAAPTVSAESRTWTDVRGRTIDATLVSATDQAVIVKLAKNGKEFTIALSKLSAKDRTFVEEWRKEGKNKPWPHRMDLAEVNVETVSEDPGTQKFVYRTKHYEIVSEVPLKDPVRDNLGLLLENTRKYILSMPLILHPALAEEEGRRNEIYLYGTRESYGAAGGVENTRGAMIAVNGSNRVLLLMRDEERDCLTGSAVFRLSRLRRTVIHEIAHQLDSPRRNLREPETWWMEGFANYVGKTPFTKKGFDDKGLLDEIVPFVTGDNSKTEDGCRLGEKPAVADLEAFLVAGRTNPQVYNLYGVSLLLVYYFLQVDGDGDRAALTKYLQARRNGESQEAQLSALLNGRTWDKLEAEIAAFWKKKGIDLSFQ